MAGTDLTEISSGERVRSGSGSEKKSGRVTSCNGDFGKIMLERSKKSSIVSDSVSVKPDNVKNDSKKEDDKISSSDKDGLLKTDSKIKKKITDKTKENNKSDDSGLKEASDSFSQSVEKILKDELSVSSSDIEDAMAKLGLQFTDLIDPSNLIKVITLLKGSNDNLSMLMSEEIPAVMKMVSDLSKEISETLSMKTEELQAAFLSENNKAGSIDISEMDPVKNDQALSQDEMKLLNTVQPKDSTAAEKADTSAKDTASPDDPSIQPEFTVIKTENEGGNFADDTGKDMSHNSHMPNISTSALNENTGLQADNYIPFQAEEKVNARDIISQIASQIKNVRTEDMQRLTMTLKPEHLGKLMMDITEKNGIVRARIITENENVKNALETQLELFKTSVNERGLKVNEIEISVASHGAGEGGSTGASPGNMENNGSNGSGNNSETDNYRMRNIDLHNTEDMPDDMTEAEKITASIMRAEGNRVNYSA